MGIVFGAIAPHGFTIIPEMSEDADGGLKTREAMEELSRRFEAARPEVVVIASPHGFRVDGSVVLANVGRAAGTLRWKGRQC
jgi:aromatic ring-opening dioxygenase LigB subunit